MAYRPEISLPIAEQAWPFNLDNHCFFGLSPALYDEMIILLRQYYDSPSKFGLQLQSIPNQAKLYKYKQIMQFNLPAIESTASGIQGSYGSTQKVYDTGTAVHKAMFHVCRIYLDINYSLQYYSKHTRYYWPPSYYPHLDINEVSNKTPLEEFSIWIGLKPGVMDKFMEILDETIPGMRQDDAHISADDLAIMRTVLIFMDPKRKTTTYLNDTSLNFPVTHSIVDYRGLLRVDPLGQKNHERAARWVFENSFETNLSHTFFRQNIFDATFREPDLGFGPFLLMTAIFTAPVAVAAIAAGTGTAIGGAALSSGLPATPIMGGASIAGIAEVVETADNVGEAITAPTPVRPPPTIEAPKQILPQKIVVSPVSTKKEEFSKTEMAAVGVILIKLLLL